MERVQNEIVKSSRCYWIERLIHLVCYVLNVREQYPVLVDTFDEMREFSTTKRLALLAEIQLIRGMRKKGSGIKKFFGKLLIKYHKYKFGKVLNNVRESERKRLIREIIKAERYNEYSQLSIGRG